MTRTLLAAFLVLACSGCHASRQPIDLPAYDYRHRIDQGERTDYHEADRLARASWCDDYDSAADRSTCRQWLDRRAD